MCLWWKTTCSNAPEFLRSGNFRPIWLTRNGPAAERSVLTFIRCFRGKMTSKLSNNRPPELLKSLSNRLAHSAMLPEQRELTGMLRFAGLLGPRSYSPGPNSPAARGDSAKADRVGIWVRQSEDGHFVRSTEMVDEWLLWANLQQIEKKGRKLRVILIGESVARGYLYEPEFTPALALRMVLEARMGKDQVEVIDLARVNLGLSVIDLALSALALEPDAAIIFSGNNWRCPL